MYNNNDIQNFITPSFVKMVQYADDNIKYQSEMIKIGQKEKSLMQTQ